MAKFYGTFGCGQEYTTKVQPIEAPDCTIARKIMFRLYGPHFCTIYDETYYRSGVVKYYSGDYLLPERGVEVLELPTKIQTTCCNCNKPISEENEVVINDNNGRYYCSEKCAIEDSLPLSVYNLNRDIAEEYDMVIVEVSKDEV